MGHGEPWPRGFPLVLCSGPGQTPMPLPLECVPSSQGDARPLRQPQPTRWRPISSSSHTILPLGAPLQRPAGPRRQVLQVLPRHGAAVPAAGAAHARVVCGGGVGSGVRGSEPRDAAGDGRHDGGQGGGQGAAAEGGGGGGGDGTARAAGTPGIAHACSLAMVASFLHDG